VSRVLVFRYFGYGTELGESIGGAEAGPSRPESSSSCRHSRRNAVLWFSPWAPKLTRTTDDFFRAPSRPSPSAGSQTPCQSPVARTSSCWLGVLRRQGSAAGYDGKSPNRVSVWVSRVRQLSDRPADFSPGGALDPGLAIGERTCGAADPPRSEARVRRRASPSEAVRHASCVSLTDPGSGDAGPPLRLSPPGQINPPNLGSGLPPSA
jgi:hypothetical protein